jgi:hypothetical protein
MNNCIIGRVRHKDGSFTNKDTLSYSGYDLWKKNREGYRRRYYENEKPFETAETIFGKTAHEEFEKTSVGAETELRGKIAAGDWSVRLLGYLDSFDEKTLNIRDHKTGHLDRKGKVPWDRVKVQRHKQLVFYSLLVLLNFGKFCRTSCLDWHETEYGKDAREFDGHVLEGQTGELRLTGRVESFRRKVYGYEVEALRKDIINTAKEIHEDYKDYKAYAANADGNKQSDEPDGPHGA